MITFTDILVLMLAYAGLSVSGICLIWYFNNSGSVREAAKVSAFWRTTNRPLRQY
jgi:hypothetical protein